MTAVLLSRCSGLWRRTLLIEADGSQVTDGDVRWLQGESAYIDSRGFGGRLEQRGDVAPNDRPRASGGVPRRGRNALGG
jgi:hypothetical protein